MVLIAFVLSFLLACFRRTFKYSVFPVFFALLIKAPCKDSFIQLGGDDINYQNAFIRGSGLSDIIFTKFYHYIYLLSNSLDFTYLMISVMTVLLSALAYIIYKKCLFSPIRFYYIYPVLAILPMVLTGAIRQNFGYLLSLLMLTTYFSSLFFKPRNLYSIILPTFVIFSFVGHFTTILFLILFLVIYHMCFYPGTATLTYKSFLGYATSLKVPSFVFNLSIPKSSTRSAFLLIFFASLFCLYLLSFGPNTSLSVVGSTIQSVLPNLYLDLSATSIYSGFTLWKKFIVVFVLSILVFFYRDSLPSKFTTNLLLSLLDYFLLCSLLIALLGLNIPFSLFPKLMRISTLIEISSLFIASSVLPRFILLSLTGILFTSTYFSAVAREDYLMYLPLPFINALSYCTF
tara:strand:+ start:6136 stop:7341 length:1206 start_codon:yes stop_codon:yes gene_type:complete